MPGSTIFMNHFNEFARFCDQVMAGNLGLLVAKPVARFLKVCHAGEVQDNKLDSGATDPLSVIVGGVTVDVQVSCRAPRECMRPGGPARRAAPVASAARTVGA